MWVSVRACVRSYVFKRTCVHACVPVRVYANPHPHAHTHTHTPAGTHTLNKHTNSHTHTHIHPHTHTHLRKQSKGGGAYQHRWEALPSTYVGFFIITHRDTYTHAKFAIYFLIRVTGARIILPLNITSRP